MKDFLYSLLNEDEIQKNPTKAFAAFTALKFQQVDEKNEEQDAKDKEQDKEIGILMSQVQSLRDLTVSRKEHTELLRDYDKFKTKMGIVVVGGTILINVLVWILQRFAVKLL